MNIPRTAYAFSVWQCLCHLQMQVYTLSSESFFVAHVSALAESGIDEF